METTGLTLEQQYAVGMAALGSGRVLDDDEELRGRGVLSAGWAARSLSARACARTGCWMPSALSS